MILRPWLLSFVSQKYEGTVTECIVLFFSSGVLILTVKNKNKNIIIFNVLILPILSSILKHFKIEKPENTD